MVDIHQVNTVERDGVDGIEIEWESRGLTEKGARFRAVGATAMRFPTTVTEAEVVGVKEFGKRDYNVIVFIPTEGFPSVGITNPVEWLENNFGNKFRG